MKTKLLYLLMFFLGILTANAQEQDNSNSAMISKLIKTAPIELFGSTTEVMCGSNFVYLGEVTTANKEVYQLATFYIKLGKACKQTSRILIYDGESHYLGNFSYKSEILPTGIDKDAITGEGFPRTNLSKGIPKSISITPKVLVKFEKAAPKK